MDEFEHSPTGEEIMRLSLFPEMLGGLSHELAQPLNAITLACEVMRLKIGRTDLSDAEKDFFDIRLKGVKNQVTRAVSLMEQFRFLFNEQVKQDGPADICKSLDRVLELVAQQLSARGINLTIERPVDVVYSKWPPRLVEMAVAHCLVFIRNRIDFLKKLADESAKSFICNLSIEVRSIDSGAQVDFRFDERGPTDQDDSSVANINSFALQAAMETVSKHGGALILEKGLVRLMLP